jgi:hypothetical protein
MKCKDCGNDMSKSITERKIKGTIHGTMRIENVETFCRRCGKTLPTYRVKFAGNGDFVSIENSDFLDAL